MRQARREKRRATALTFSADELTALARHTSAGGVLLQGLHPVMSRFKAALTRLGLPSPMGL